MGLHTGKGSINFILPRCKSCVASIKMRSSRSVRPPPTAPLSFLTRSWGAKLALDCIEEEFGHTVMVRVNNAQRVRYIKFDCRFLLIIQCVAEATISMGPSTMDEIRRFLTSQSASSSTTGSITSILRVRLLLVCSLRPPLSQR